MNSSSDVAELLFWLMQSSSENDTYIQPKSPHPVLRIPSQIQILKTDKQMSSDKMRGTTLRLNDNKAYSVGQG
jgi:hypothetical protein